MMRKIFVSSTVIAALCSLAISVAPALGLELDFDGEATESISSSTTQTIELGTSGRVECLKMTMKAVLKVGAFTKLHATLEKYTTCSYHHKLVEESVTETVPTCSITLESAYLEETAEEKFEKGRVKDGCTLEFESASGCLVEVSGSSAALPEYEWLNLNGTPKHYESLIHFRVEGFKYAISKVGSGACNTDGAGGSEGGWVGSIPIKSVIVPPVF